MTILLLLVGLGLVVLGADWLVEGASSISRKAGVSEFVIGLTIVGFGTSCPELVVSLTGALEGNADIAVGNVIGSNVFNILLILGSSALITPLSFASVTAADWDLSRRWPPKNCFTQSLHLYNCLRPLRPFLTTFLDPQKKHFF